MAGSTPHIVSFSGTTVSQDVASVMTDSGFFLGCTGLNEGDYVFFAPRNSRTKNNSTAYASSGQLGVYSVTYRIYRINSGNEIVPITNDDTLAYYNNMEKSIWHFDNRNNCLTIGTTESVYVLEFDPTTKTWTQIISNLGVLPDNNSGEYIYNAMISPEKTRIAVYAGDGYDFEQKLFVYDISLGHAWSIVEDGVIYYDNELAFSGVYTGESTVDGYKVKTVLPTADDVSCTLDMDTETYVPVLDIV